MFRKRREGEQPYACVKPDCPKLWYPAQELLFLCPNLLCPGRNNTDVVGKPPKWAGRTLFRPERFTHKAPCPYSIDPDFPDRASSPVCPYCWQEQPYFDSQPSTIAVVGASISGKPCY